MVLGTEDTPKSHFKLMLASLQKLKLCSRLISKSSWGLDMLRLDLESYILTETQILLVRYISESAFTD